MLGFLFSVIAGVTMSLQGVFNTRLSEKIGLWETTLIVQGSSFLITILVFLFLGHNSFKDLKNINKLYLLGGLLAVAITYTVMLSISNLGPTFAIAIILISQLLSAAIIEYMGLFETPCCKFSTNEYLGVFLMLIGIVIFKFLKF